MGHKICLGDGSNKIGNAKMCNENTIFNHNDLHL